MKLILLLCGSESWQEANGALQGEIESSSVRGYLQGAGRATSRGWEAPEVSSIGGLQTPLVLKEHNVGSGEQFLEVRTLRS